MLPRLPQGSGRQPFQGWVSGGGWVPRWPRGGAAGQAVLDRNRDATYRSHVTAAQIMQEIKALPVEEQAAVIRFAYRLDAERQLTGQELASLADRLVRATGPEETSVLRAEMVRGFYGGKPSA